MIFTMTVDLDAMGLPHPQAELADVLKRVARDIGRGDLAGPVVTVHGENVGRWSIEAAEARRRHRSDSCRPEPTKCTNCGTSYQACTNRIYKRRLSACCDECSQYDCHGLKEAGLL